MLETCVNVSDLKDLTLVVKVLGLREGVSGPKPPLRFVAADLLQLIAGALV